MSLVLMYCFLCICAIENRANERAQSLTLMSVSADCVSPGTRYSVEQLHQKACSVQEKLPFPDGINYKKTRNKNGFCQPTNIYNHLLNVVSTYIRF